MSATPKKPANKTPPVRPSDNGTGDPFAKIRDQLIRKRTEIVQQRANQLDELLTPDKHHLADLEEMSGDTVDTDSMCALVDMETDTLEAIEVALAKLEEGTYGVCEDCDKPIPPQRLEVLPFTTLCIDCKRQRELRDG